MVAAFFTFVFVLMGQVIFVQSLGTGRFEDSGIFTANTFIYLLSSFVTLFLVILFVFGTLLVAGEYRVTVLIIACECFFLVLLDVHS